MTDDVRRAPQGQGQGLSFPADFLWGAATAAHQVEGGNVNSDWWAWENDSTAAHRPAEPSGIACDHWNRYREDIALLARAGLGVYRFSVEWARIEPLPGHFDQVALDHYSDMVDACLEQGVMPFVVLQHFTLPRWVEQAGSWLNPQMPAWFAHYTRAVMARIGKRLSYVATINEPGNLMTRGYPRTYPTPPFKQDLDAFYRACSTLNDCHLAAREAIRQTHSHIRVGMAHALQHWTSDRGGAPLVEFARTLHEDLFFREAAKDDYIGVQTYTELTVNAPAFAAPVLRTILRSPMLVRKLVLPVLRRSAQDIERKAHKPDGTRRTLMGYPYAPKAVGHVIRRVAKLFPGKDIILTEHGIATADDAERIEYTSTSLAEISQAIAEGVPVRGYFHWSLLDNYEWWDGYRPTYGLFAVDRTTRDRSAKPSVHWLADTIRRSRAPS